MKDTFKMRKYLKRCVVFIMWTFLLVTLIRVFRTSTNEKQKWANTLVYSTSDNQLVSYDGESSNHCPKLLQSLPKSTLLLIYLEDTSSWPFTHFYSCLQNSSVTAVTFTPLITETLNSYSSKYSSFQTLNNSETLYRSLSKNIAKTLLKSDKNYVVYLNLQLAYRKETKVLDFAVKSDECFFHFDNMMIGGNKQDMACTLQCAHNYVSTSQGGMVNITSDTLSRCAHQRRSCSSPVTKPAKKPSYEKDVMDFGCYCWMYDPKLSCDMPTASNGQCLDTMKVAGSSMEDVHLVYATDKEQYTGMVASIRSIVSTSQYRSYLHFHIFQCTDCQHKQSTHLKDLVEEIKACGVKIRIHPFTSKEVLPFINTHHKDRPDLMNANNYIRFLLPEKMPHVTKCMWLDSDILVVKDIVPFLNSIKTDKVIAAFPEVREQKSIPPRAYQVLKNNKVPVVKQGSAWFIAGSIVINLKRWKETNTTAKLLRLSSLNAKHQLYVKSGSQAPLTLLFGGDRFLQLNRDLFTGYLGCVRKQQLKCSSQFLHWNGSRKPWLKKALYKEVWKRLNKRTFHLQKLKCQST